MAEYRSLRREIDEVTRQYQERCGAFEKKLHEYDDAQAEAARLFALATDLQVQIGKQKKTVDTIEQEIKPQLEFFNSAFGHDTASSDPPEEPDVGNAHIAGIKTLGNIEPGLESTDTLEVTPGATPIATNRSTTHTIELSPADSISPNSVGNKFITDKAASNVVDEVEAVQGHKFTIDQIKTILERYPHGTFKGGRLFLRKCIHCGANAGRNKDGTGARFFQGDMGVVRHMRGHGWKSGLNSQNVDEHCIMGEAIPLSDLILLGDGKDPRNAETIIEAKHVGRSAKLSYNDESSTNDTDTRNDPVALAADAMEMSVPEERPRKRARKSKSMLANGFVPINVLDYLDDEDDEYLV